MAKIVFVNELLSDPSLIVPLYQRPYKWQRKNIEELLSDMSNALIDKKKNPSDFYYRIGTIILHSDEDKKLNIVDGQQRIISLTLLKKYLDPCFHNQILDFDFENDESKSNIKKNYLFIRHWFSLKDNTFKDEIKKALDDFFQFVEIVVFNQSEAFQLFDSQNNRGKSLEPHDLLKAYHLREMKNDKYSMIHAVEKWERKDSEEIKNLFNLFLFPIYNWCNKEKTVEFTEDEIDTYKGVSDLSYSFTKRILKCDQSFQISEFFESGNSFFEYVNYYDFLVVDIVRELFQNPRFSTIKEILSINQTPQRFKDVLNINKTNSQLSFARTLFFNVLLCYYDKFHNFDEMAVKKLFIWAMMIRVDMIKLKYETINDYSVGQFNNSYSNTIPMFFKIKTARKHTEIANIDILTKRDGDCARSSSWAALYSNLKKMNGMTDE